MFEIDEKPKAPISSTDDSARLGDTPKEKPHSLTPPIVQMRMKRSGFWSKLRLTSQLLLICSLVVMGISFHKKGELPAPAQILPSLRIEPIQQRTNTAPFDFTYRGSTYTVEPVADYELSGVVVTHNNISGIGDSYHNSDSVDMKDICVVWGNNILTDNYRKLHYWSEPWTCNVQSDDQESWSQFFPNQLSNNHLLAEDEVTQARIRSVHLGDQIQLRGMLVNYYPKGAPELKRKSSTTRTDNGNGACEVVFVKSFEILKPATPGWYHLWSLGIGGCIVAILLGLFVFFRAPLGQ